MDIEITVPDGEAGPWKVETFTVSDGAGRPLNPFSFSSGGRYVPDGTYKKLTCNNCVIMSNTPSEIRDHLDFIFEAKKCERVLINGLGLGVALKAILESDTVKWVDVVEISEDVIKLVGPTYLEDPRVTILHADAFEYKPPKGVRYGAVWHDIWPSICEENLPEMHKLHRKYGRRADWQGSWCRWQCERSRRESQEFERRIGMFR